MSNAISWFEIPVQDFSRAKKFYSEVLKVDIHEADMGDMKMGFFPSSDKTVSGALVKGADYEPSQKGALVYLNTGDDLTPALNRIEKAGGKVLLTKTEIPKTGFFAIFLDSEQNKLALFSKH